MAQTVSGLQRRGMMSLLAVFVTLTLFTNDCAGISAYVQPIQFTSSSSGASNATDGKVETAWTLTTGQTEAFLNANFSEPQAVYGVRLTIQSAAKPDSISIRLLGVSTNWLIFVNKTCTDPFYRWLNDTDLRQCVTSNASGVTTIEAKLGLFTAINITDGNPRWWEPFSQLTLTIAGQLSDFSAQSAAFSIGEILVFGWPHRSACNCDPTANYSGPICNAPSNSACNCPPIPSSLSVAPSPTCRPVIQPLDAAFPAYYGPLSGGTAISLNGTFGKRLASITIGDLYRCKDFKAYDDSVLCIAPPAKPMEQYLNVPIPFYICYVDSSVKALSCVVTRDEFTYLPSDPNITGVSRRNYFSGGRLPITITGTNFSSVYALSIPSSMRHIYPFTWPFIDLLDDTTSKYTYRYYDTTGDQIQSPSDTNPIVPCTVNLSNSGTGQSSIVCRTPDVRTVTKNDAQLSIYSLEVCLGTFSEVNSTTIYPFNPICMYRYPLDLVVCGVPSNVQLANTVVYGSNPTIGILANQMCCQPKDCSECKCVITDYMVTVGDQPCEVSEVINNALYCQPPPCPWPNYSPTKGAQVTLYIGSYSVSVGSVKCNPTFCELNDYCPALIGGVVGGGGGLLLIIVAIIIVVCAVKYKEKRDWERLTREDPFHEYIVDQSFGFIPQAERDDLLLRIEADRIREKVLRCRREYSRMEVKEEIGKGNFGQVFRGTYTDRDGSRKDAAIKTAKNDNVKEKIEFLMEAVIMADFDHENVLSLFGIVIHDSQPYAILPMMEHGDLRNYVLNKKNQLTVRLLLGFCEQVAAGMQYLSEEAKFVHRDLAARNCMINSEMVVKVADFGLARDIFEDDYYRAQDMQRPLPFKWMALECLSPPAKFTVKSDVWSYGVLMWEVLTRGQKPYQNVMPQELKNYLRHGGRLDKPPNAPSAVYELMKKCWQADPDWRPSFREIKTELTQFLAGAGGTDRSKGPENETYDEPPALSTPDAVPLRQLPMARGQVPSAVDNAYNDGSVIEIDHDHSAAVQMNF